MQLIAATLLLLQAVISVHTELVAVPVIVTGARGQRVSGLTQENFRVFEDGWQRDIVVLTSGRRRLPVRTRSGYVLEP